MNEIVRNLESYIRETLGVESKACPWEEKGSLPIFLVNFYDFYEILLLNNPCLLMVVKEEVSVSPAAVKKHRKQIESKWAGCCIYVQEAIPPHNRQRLIQHRVPFIAPGNQMYLPDIGIDLREYFQQPKSRRELLSPATQAVVIYALCHDPSEGYTASELIKELKYSRMTLIRAFKELESLRIGTIDRKGKERRWSFRDGKRALWKQTKPVLSSPVKQRIWIKGKTPKITAGLSALSEHSMLNPPPIPIYATGTDDWKKRKESGVEILPISEGATAELEVWHYNPSLSTKQGAVDLFSLYLSLRNTEDERIEAALEEVMENIEW